MNEARVKREQRAIDAWKFRFEETGNPVFAWDAYARARRAGLTLPRWVLEYFDTCGRNIGHWVQRARDGENIADAASKIATSFQMARGKGRATVFSEFASEVFDWDYTAWGEAVAAYVRIGKDVSLATDLVAEDFEKIKFDVAGAAEGWAARPNILPPSKSTILRAFERYCEMFPNWREMKSPIS